MAKGLVNRLADGISVIPINSIVYIKGASDEVLYRVVTILVYEGKRINYSIMPLRTGHTPIFVDESNIVLVKKEGANYIDVYEDEDSAISVKDQIPGVSIHKRLEMLQGFAMELDDSIGYILSSTKSKFDWLFDISIPEDMDEDDAPRISVMPVTVNGYVRDKFVVAGELYVYIRLPEDEGVEILSRELKLKPFRKRIINTLLYGRNHIGNFIEVESIQDFEKRVKEHIEHLYKEVYGAVLVTGEYAYSSIFK